MRRRRYEYQPVTNGPFDPYANNDEARKTPSEIVAGTSASLSRSLPAPIDPYANDDLQALLAMPELPVEAIFAPAAKTVMP